MTDDAKPAPKAAPQIPQASWVRGGGATTSGKHDRWMTARQVDAESRRIGADDTPETLYEWVAESDARMLTRHLPALLAGTAPRVPQDMTRRGPLTSADGYRRWLNQSS